MSRLPDSYYEQLRVEIGSLRGLLEGQPHAGENLLLFDDFLEHAEFGLALETLCDYLQQQAVKLEPATLDSIASLSSRMELKDGWHCIEALRHNAGR